MGLPSAPSGGCAELPVGVLSRSVSAVGVVGVPSTPSICGIPPPEHKEHKIQRLQRLKHFFLEKKGQIMRIKYLTMLQDATDKNDTFSSFF